MYWYCLCVNQLYRKKMHANPSQNRESPMRQWNFRSRKSHHYRDSCSHQRDFVLNLSLVFTTLRKKCPNTEFFWSTFSRTGAKYGDLLRKSHFSRNGHYTSSSNWLWNWYLVLSKNEELKKFTENSFETCVSAASSKLSWILNEDSVKWRFSE